MSSFAIRHRRSLVFLIIFSFTIVLSTRFEIDLNQPAAECWEEVKIPSVDLGDSPGKRKTHPVQFLSFSPATSRICLSHTVTNDVPSRSDFFNLRLTAQDKFDPSNLGGKHSNFVDNLTVREGMIPPKHGCNSNKEPPNVQKSPKQPVPYNYFLPKEHVVEQLLKKYSTQFDNELSLIQTFIPGEKHKYLPFARATKRKVIGIQVFKVLKISGDGIQPRQELIRLYNCLTASLYKIHREKLHHFRVTTFNHRIQQEKLLDWLFKQIFHPDHSPPVMGVIHFPYLSLSLNDPKMKIGAIQEKLINYFSKPSYQADYDVGQISNDLLKIYEDQNPIDYASLSHSAKASHEDNFSMIPSFKASTEFLSNCIEDSDYLVFRKYAIKKSPPNSTLFNKANFMFSKLFEKLKVSKTDFKSYHPELPVAMFFIKEEHGQQALRMIRTGDGKICNERIDAIPRFKTLLKILDHLHVKALEKLNITGSKLNEMRDELFQYVLKEIANPDLGLPLLGLYKANQGIPPWYDPSMKDFKLFGELQLKLLEFFTEDLTDSQMKDISVYILNLWLYHKNPSYFSYLNQDLATSTPSIACCCLVHRPI